MHGSVFGVAVSCLVGAALAVVPAATPAFATAPTPVCGATTCTTTYAATGDVQTFSVPSFVSSVTVSVSGGQGGDEISGTTTVVEAGGSGGVSTATVPVTAASILAIVVGQAGGPGRTSTGTHGSGGFGGGGAGGSSGVPANVGIGGGGGGGGGGSFVFAADNSLLIAAGGGSGAVPTHPGGSGGSGNAAATGGTGDSGGKPGTATGNGSGGFSNGGALDASAGSGTAAGASSLAQGGAGAGGTYAGGSGGGGGYHAGGGGGGSSTSTAASGSGGGGAGYAMSSATSLGGAAGAQSGDGQVTVTYNKGTQAVTFRSSPPASAELGQTYDVSATGGGSGNSVVYSIDAATTNAACSISGATVSFDHPGSCVINANQAGNDDYLAATVEQQALTVVRDESSTTVSVQPTTLTATVAAVTPADRAPSGSVSVSVDGDVVGTAVLDAGVATLSDVIAPGSAHTVFVVYDGDDRFAGSSGTTVRRDPTVTASLSSAKKKTNGWYRTPVAVTFHCAPTSAALTKSCPVAVTVTRNGKSQAVRRTVTAADGGSATVAATGLNIDQVKPVVRILGPKAGAVYRHKVPKARCVGADALSGLRTCVLHHAISGRRVTVTATATDRAGNTAKKRLNYKI